MVTDHEGFALQPEAPLTLVLADNAQVQVEAWKCCRLTRPRNQQPIQGAPPKAAQRVYETPYLPVHTHIYTRTTHMQSELCIIVLNRIIVLNQEKLPE